MSRAAILFGLVAVLTAPAAVQAWGSEQLGNAPLREFDSPLFAAVNVPERVYYYEVNGNPAFFFKGGPQAVNAAVRRFAALPAERREIVLVPGPGVTRTFDRKPVAYDWSLHVPMGLRFGGDSEVADTRATLTIHITAPVPPPPADPAKVKRWIGELNSDDFKTRERAAKELTAAGPAVAALVREALKDTRAVEARERLERVLAALSTEIRLDLLELPNDIPVVGPETLLGRARRELSNKSPEVRGYAASSLWHPAATAEDVLPDLEKVLKDEKGEYPLRCAMSVAAQLGAAARPLLPALREHLTSDDKNVRHMARSAIEMIEAAKPEAELWTRAVIRKEIREFVERREPKAK